ncbi:EAL domain-containing protein [Maricaulis sp.]|uniref:putative bifunctional diguanylate cyclase/phosphodiesterase n=1 Tax=Maricaulis sp. TaxID=1486257 RepID=UPI00260F7E27|nr:EAL domain-containing protein [Maricaulis sp.]
MTTFRPIVNGAGLVGMAFFAFNAIKRFGFSEGLGQMVMGPLAIFFGVASGVMWLWTRKNRTSFQLEVCSAVICLALFSNTVTHLLIGFEAENLMYFAIMMPAFALMTPSFRMAMFWTALCVIAMLGVVWINTPELIFEYISVAVAGVLGAVAATTLIRGAIFNAVSARLEAVKEREEALRISVKDALTGLPNRRSFFDGFEDRLDGLRDSGRKFLLILVDLDGFKPVNDVYGHSAGDDLLRAVAGRLEAASPKGAMAARLGGDEFAVLADYPAQTAEVRRIASRLVDALSLPYSLPAGVVRISGSAGVYVCERTDLEASAMIERADHALYQAKNERRGEAVVFSKRDEVDLANVNHVDRCLRQADLENELSLVFQPQFDLVNNRVSGFEALGRWNNEQLGAVPPSIFIAAAERTTQMSRVTHVLLGKALKALADLPGGTRLAVNLSAHDLMSEANVQKIAEQIRLSGVDATRLELEITETAMLDDQDFASRSLGELQACGVSIALDDFGSGYSNFSYLQRLHVSKLKIDRSFVKPLMSEASAAKILRTLISLSKSLSMECVVEGIEKPEEMAYATAFGARYLQGFLLSKPMPLEAIPDFMTGVPTWIEQMQQEAGAVDIDAVTARPSTRLSTARRALP